MWANFARGTYFTAGNTTTNRIESNWNQVKMLLGHKTRIDKTIAGLLQHQMTITQQIVSTIGQHHSSSRLSKAIPMFLRGVARRLSAEVLAKVKKEWERYVNLMSNTECMRVGSCVSLWKVHCFGDSFMCDDLEWSCSRLFYKSNHLPCCHLINLAREGHKLEMLPSAVVDGRWDTLAALKVNDELAAAADALRPIVQMSNIKSPKPRLLEDDGSAPASTSNPPKQFVYVRLRRHERANQVVLSSAEKYSYGKAMLEPLLSHLTSLSSPDFYMQPKAWNETVDEGLRLDKASTPAMMAMTIQIKRVTVATIMKKGVKLI